MEGEELELIRGGEGVRSALIVITGGRCLALAERSAPDHRTVNTGCDDASATTNHPVENAHVVTSALRHSLFLSGFNSLVISSVLHYTRS